MISTRWLLSNRVALDAKFLELSWHQRLDLGLFDFEVSLLGGKHIGRGTAESQDIAMAKAVSEALERMVCSEFGISTQGVAAHPILAMAEKNSTLEALERTIFQYHLDYKIPFAEDTVVTENSRLVDAVKDLGGQVSMKKMIRVSGYESSICLIENEGFKFLGLSLENSKELAQNKSLIEALRNFSAFCENQDKFIHQVKASSDLWNCNPIFFEKHKAVFNTKSPDQIFVKNFRSSAEELNSKIHQNLPVSVVKAQVSIEVST